MAEPTNTRAVLRRAIGRLTRQQFYLRYGGNAQSVTAVSTAATLAITSSVLTQANDFWNSGWLYMVEADTERKITDFVASTDAVVPEWPLDTGASTDTLTFEITDIWPPSQIHEAINRAIDEAGRWYPDVVRSDTDFVLEENKLRYAVPSTGASIYKIHQVWAERVDITKLGQVSSTTNGSSSITDTDVAIDFDPAPTTSWLISTYFGTGSGQLRNVSTADTASGKWGIDADWTTAPDTTTRFRVWNPNSQPFTWWRMLAARPEPKEYPDWLYLNELMPEVYGFRMGIVSLNRPASLSVDSDATVVPMEFVVHKAASILYDSLVSDNRFDRQKNASLAEYHDQIARQYAKDNPRRVPETTWWQEQGMGGPSYWTQDDPLGWRSG